MGSSSVMISRELQVTLQLAVTEAADRHHEYICLEHLLYAMLHDVTTSNILQNCGADLDVLRKKLAAYLDREVERLPTGGGAFASLRARRPARVAACRGPRAVRRASGNQRRQRAGRDVPGDRIARAVPAPGSRRHALRRGQLHLARRLQDRRRPGAGIRRSDGEDEAKAGEEGGDPSSRPPRRSRLTRST